MRARGRRGGSLRDASGAVTVEWAVMTAAAALLAVGVAGPLRPALDGVSTALVGAATTILGKRGWDG